MTNTHSLKTVVARTLYAGIGAFVLSMLLLLSAFMGGKGELLIAFWLFVLSGVAAFAAFVVGIVGRRTVGTGLIIGSVALLLTVIGLFTWGCIELSRSWRLF